MGQGLTDRLTGLRVGNARGVLLGAASLVVVVLAVVLVVAGVTSGEVAATVLFLPVFAAGFVAGRTAGYGAAAVATLIYVAVRREDLSSAGAASSGVLTLTRAAAYLVAGHVGSLAQMLVPGGADGAPGAGRPSTRPSAGDRRRPARADATASHRPADPAWHQAWDDGGPPPGRDRRAPVLAGVGSPGAGADGGHDRYDPYSESPQTMSNAWPPEPPRDPWRDEPPARPPRRPDDRGWDADGGGGDWPAAGGWQSGDDAGRPEDDSWAAVQQSWREQHGVPADDQSDDPRGRGQDEMAQDDWSHHQQARGPAGAPPPDPWGDAAPTGGTWPQAPAQGGWQDAPPARDAGGWQDAPPAYDAGGWQDAPPAADGWTGEPASNRWGGEPADDGRPAGVNGWGPEQDRNDGVNGWGPEQDRNGGVNGWGPETAAPADNGWGGEPAGPDGWPAGTAVNGHGWSTESDVPPAAPAWDTPAPDDWSPRTGQTQAVWDDPAAGHAHESDPGHDHHGGADPWGAPAGPGWVAGAPTTGGFDPRTGRATGPIPVVPPEVGGSSGAALPAVDPETGLWTAKFLRDRLSSEQVRSRRSGRPFSLVLVQVPDGPLAQLPYRRQLTLLRELGYQFVAGGVVDHLVHVPDQAQHWFAVVLPDTDRSGAQVLERRLRLGIGGYLSSRGLRLRDLDSASLTAPDDDPAMGAIWDGLIGPDDDGAGYHR